jgi:quercetin dioxygenase-like cupin family protein
MPPPNAQEDTVNLKTTVFATLAIAAVVTGLSAQQPGFKRTVLQQQKLSMAGHEAVTAVAEFQPGGTVGRHTHPGEEIGYVLEGSIVLEQAGRPPVTLTAGQTFFIPNGQVHDATNKGPSIARVLANYVLESGKPVATPAK